MTYRGNHAPPADRVFVANFPFDTTDDELRHFFEDRIGRVRAVTIVKDRATGNSRGFGFVSFFEEHHVHGAVLLDGEVFQGRLIAVRDAKPRPG